METFIATVAAVSMLFSASADMKMCKKVGFANWSKVIYEKGVAKKIECYDKKWDKREIILTTNESGL